MGGFCPHKRTINKIKLQFTPILINKQKLAQMMNKLFATTLLSTAVAFSARAQDVTGTIHANQGTQKINREIYGQFAEHLGSCIYGGLWVGP